MIEFAYGMADPDFFAPMETYADPGRVYRAGKLPAGWRSHDRGHWTFVAPDGLSPAPRGWKVHVSARLDRAQEVLDVFAAVCVAQGVAFKHLSNEITFLFAHHKHSSRAQSGKFCVAYPADQDASADLMKLLAEALDGEEGPFILTDRRYPGSTVVHYRYGSFTEGRRMRPDGTAASLVTDGAGRLVEDVRGVAFHLPEGITDPFERPETEQPAPEGLATFREYTFERALRHSNGGGAYRAVHKPTGRTVFVKEARDHNGLSWDGVTAPERLRREWETLRAVHALAPGLCPEPVAYFRVWEHEYLVTEFIEGTGLQKWMVSNAPLVKSLAGPDDFAAYYEDCERLLHSTGEALRRLHDLGFAFGDVSPGNVQVTADGTARLIDFETAHRIGEPRGKLGTDGYAPPPGTVDDPVEADRYGHAALAQLLLCPIHSVVQRNPDALTHLRHDLTERAPVPEPLWRCATRFHRPTENPVLPSPEEIAAEPATHLARLRDGIADAIAAMTEPGHPDRVFPTCPPGYETNALCLAYGTAGVLHALRRANAPVPGEIVDRLRREALDIRRELPPGLHAGLAGIAWVLADHDRLDEAETLLATALDHPLTGECATLAGGSAGIAMAHLHLYRHTRDNRHRDTAAALAEALPARDDLIPHLGADNAVGLLNGRTGIASMLQQLAHVTGDDRYLGPGVALLHDEFDLVTDPDAPVWSFPVSDADRRTTPYLGIGTAGVLATVSRYLRSCADERLTEALPALTARPTAVYTAYPGLYPGLSGIGLAMSEHAQRYGDEASRATAVRLARALFKYAIPHGTGVRFLGDRNLRFSADLNNGMAGILLFLTHLLDPRPDPLFTVDAFGAAPPAQSS